MNKCFAPPRKFFLISLIIALFFWACAATRHALLQSNAYDLGLFDQWIWLVSRGFPPYSSMEGVHILADHGAWLLYLAAIPYYFYPTVHWLFFTQAFALVFTALPLWFLGRNAGLSSKFCWLVCGLWWLQPVVFNVNLFDFHPEVWVMPILASCYLFLRINRPYIWFFMLLLLLGSRDGLILVVAGLGTEQVYRRNFTWGLSAIGLSLGWLAFLNKWLYPTLTGSTNGPKAAANLFPYLGSSLDEIILNLFRNPFLIFQNIDYIGGFVYLILITISIAPFWQKRSLPVLIGALPLIFINILSAESPQRTLIHHYSLPVSLIFVVAAIDGLAMHPKQHIPWKKFVWTSICWASLAKPWFFTGPYMERFDSLLLVREAIQEVSPNSRIIATSYLVPHLSQRVTIGFPRSNSFINNLEGVDTLLLNPSDPGWASSQSVQRELIDLAIKDGWKCKNWSNGLEMCKRQ